MNTQEKPKPFLSVELGEAGSVVFHNLEEIDAWLQKERVHWKWVQDQFQNPKAGNMARPSMQKFEEAWSNIQNRVAEARNGMSRPNFKDLVVSVGAAMRTFYVEQNRLHSESVRAKFVDELRTSDPSLAVLIVGHWAGVTNTSEPRYWEAVCRVALFSMGIKDRVEAETQALLGLRSDWQKQIEQADGDYRQFQKTVATFTEESEEERSSQKEQLAEDRNTQEARLSALLEDAEKRLVTVEDIYNRKLSLQSSTTYWTQKRCHHRNTSIGFAILWCVVVGLASWFLISEVKNVLAIEELKYPKDYWRFGLLSILAFFCIWLVRIMTRLFMSNIHLYQDAQERVTMVHTFLALLRDEKAIDEKERSLILQTVFRPAATGVIKDDAAPPFLWEWITKHAS